MIIRRNADTELVKRYALDVIGSAQSRVMNALTLDALNGGRHAGRKVGLDKTVSNVTVSRRLTGPRQVFRGPQTWIGRKTSNPSTTDLSKGSPHTGADQPGTPVSDAMRRLLTPPR